MPWCPNCKMEYRDEYEVCSDCDCKLVEKLDQESEEEFDKDFKETLLVSVSDDIEAGMIQAALESNNIPSIRKYRGTGGFTNIYMGMSKMGIDIYVGETEANRAREILENMTSLAEMIENNQNVDTDTKEAIDSITQIEYSNRKRQIRVWTIILMFLVPGLIAILIGVFKTILKTLGVLFLSLNYVKIT